MSSACWPWFAPSSRPRTDQGTRPGFAVSPGLPSSPHSHCGALVGAFGLRDAFSSAGWGYGYAHGHALKLRFSFLRIDHILVSPGLGGTDSFVGVMGASEHRPVIADLLLQREPG